jgi:ferric-dicitrate binding protein FerR (iron transport regulator)
METHNLIPEYLVAYLQGEANEDQKLLANDWLRVPENQVIYRQLKKIDNLTSDFQMLAKFDVKEGKQKVRKKYRTKKLVVLSTWMQRIAAVLFIPVLLGGIWFYFQQNQLRKDFASLMVTQEIITQPGTKTHLFLPDSTEVWLNSASTLSFPSVFAGNDRRVELDGEAYFEVFKNKRKPFIVSTRFQDVEAIGTAFNLSAYSGDLRFSTTLIEGKVKVADRGKTDQIAFLEPGFQLNYNTHTTVYHQQRIRVQDVIAWRDGVLIFNETPFFEVAARLGRWFNADIQISDQSIANYRFTGTFTSENLEQVMELLALSTPIDYSVSKRKMLENRNFSKQKIQIWKNENSKIKLKKIN